MELPIKTDLSGKVAVVTGAGGVLCGEFSRALAASGAKVALVNRSDASINSLAAEITAGGGVAVAFKCNVLDEKGLEDCRRSVNALLGPCDILINGAGGNSPAATTDSEYFTAAGLTGDAKNFFNLSREGVEAVFDLNFMGTLLPTQVFARDMISRKGCTVINITSMNAFTPLTKIPAYSGAKAAVSNLTQWLAVHFSREGIRVNAIAPGFFTTAQNSALLWDADGAPTARTGKILAATPMGRFGRPEELVGALLFLADEKASSFITGVVLPVDGGFNAYSGV